MWRKFIVRAKNDAWQQKWAVEWGEEKAWALHSKCDIAGIYWTHPERGATMLKDISYKDISV